MESVFDRLVREVSSEERQALLRKIGDTRSAVEEPMRLDEENFEQPLILEREFSELSFFARLRIILVGFFMGAGRNKATEDYLILRLQRRVERLSGGLFDFRRELVSPELYRLVASLQAAMDVFRRPLLGALEGDKADFYAFLGRMEFEDIQQRLETEADPEVISQKFPESVPLEIRKIIEATFEEIFGDIVPDRRRRMLAHTTALARLRVLVRFPYRRVLDLFPPGDDGAGVSASLRPLKEPLLELGDALHAFKEPPSATLLETLFIFALHDSLSVSEGRLEGELEENMDRASAALDIIRQINSDIPWVPFLRVLSGELTYNPRQVGGGEDWFRIYKDFWKRRLGDRFRQWADTRKMTEMRNGLSILWGVDIIPPISGYCSVDFPEAAPPQYAVSFSAVRCLFLDVFPGRLYHALNLIMIDGKFYKKDNRREYEEVFGRFLKMPDKIRSFEVRLRPEGEYGTKLAQLHRREASGEDVLEGYGDLLISLDRDSQNIAVPLLGDLKAMSRLLRGILEGDGGVYDALSNMAEIGGGGNDTFRDNLQDVRNVIERSASMIGDMMDLEDRRSHS